MDRPEDAGDVTADTFLVAWRRMAHAPQGPDLRPWLYGVALEMRKGAAGNDVLARLAADPRLGLTADQLAGLVAEPITFTGAAVAQTQAVVRRVAEVTARFPEAAAYVPGEIL